MSSTVSTGAGRTGAVSIGEKEGEPERSSPPDTDTGAIARPSSPSALFVPTSEEEELAVDSGWGVLREPSEAQSTSGALPPARSSILPRLELAEPEPPRLLYDKSHEPSDDSPILYCERGYVVDGLQSDEELAGHLFAELAAIREGWDSRDNSQFVQLAAFDHTFETEPLFPPLATLSWKDWQGRTEVWVRGVRHSIPPLDAELEDAEEMAAAVADALDAAEADARANRALSETTELGSSHKGSSQKDESTPVVAPALSRPPRTGDSGTSWQSPARSGEYRIPTTAVEPTEPPPSSQRMPAGEELISALFERMNELAYLPDLQAGSAYVLETLEEFIACSGIGIHLLDGAACEFVLVRALGPHAAAQLGVRQSDTESPLGQAVQQQHAVRVDPAQNGMWSALGLEISHALCAPVQQRGHIFGALEIGRSASLGEFSDNQLKALEFIGEQFAEFLSERPFDPKSLP
ncbi:MAG: GAF domain-containing protein [Deltaproteobacteria bacterium]